MATSRICGLRRTTPRSRPSNSVAILSVAAPHRGRWRRTASVHRPRRACGAARPRSRIGHASPPSVAPRSAPEAHLVADALAVLALRLKLHTACESHGGEAAGLGAEDPAIASLEQELRQLGRLAAARRPREHEHASRA
eukprot:scaffold53138_cov60-Phaeocystis_antarctica.AAC.2